MSPRRISVRLGLLCIAALLFGPRATRAQDNVTCTDEDGCAVLVPDYWTILGNVNFNFTGLEEQGPLGDFQWGIGSSPGALDVLPYQSLAGSSIRFSSFKVDTLTDIDLTIGNYTFTNQTLYVLNYSLPGQALINDQTYYVSVLTESSPPLNATSRGVQVATSQPQLERGYIYNTEDCSVGDDQRDRTALWACWDSFTDPVTAIVRYSARAYEYGDSLVPISEAVDVGLQRRVHITGLSLRVGQKYYVEVTAVNGAGVSGSTNGPPVTILGEKDGLSTVGITFVVAATIIVGALLIFLIGYLFFRRRYQLRAAMRQQEREKTKVLKSLMYSLVTSPNDGKAPVDQLRNARNLAFVITDLQSSTAQAASSPHAFLKVQEIHDTVIREGIAKHAGYEINTEGDAFHIAFASIPQAVLFSMETQYRLLDTAWPREVLRLPSCGEVTDKEGNVMLKGPRVRMGIHYAAEGTVAHRLHLLTKHRVFSGPGFQVACEVGDSANGGQVLLTHDAWMKLEPNMAAAGFPTVKQIGLFKLRAWPSPLWVYEVSHLLGRHLQRVHTEPRKIQMLETGWGLNIVSPPEPREGKLLSFVSMRLDSPGVTPGKSSARPDEGSSIRSTFSNVMGSGSASADISPLLARQLFEALATCAMQFRGYIHIIRENQGVFGAAFQSTLDAVRFAHAAQTRLLYTSWPNASKDPHCGPIEFTPDGRLLFYGLRIAMAVHDTQEFEAEKVALPSQGQREHDIHYFGVGVELAQALGRAAHGGQVLLSESAWASIQDQLPGSSQVVSLGTHIVDHSLAGPMLLMEVMPQLLGRRSFPPPVTQEMIEPGFRDSPDPAHHMALVFTRVSRPAEVAAAEQARGRMSDEDIVRVLTAFNVAVGKVSRLVRALLREYDGYECKEPEPGKFTLAFHNLESAVRWASVLQKELMEVAWPELLLSWPDCAQVVTRRKDGSEGPLLWKGLRIRIGMACGKPQHRKPLNTGRADYYGSLPNLAARVAALAHPGQILVEGSSGFAEEVKWYPEDNVAVLSLPSSFSSTSTREDIELHLLGFYLIKDLDDAKPILQANPSSLVGREYEPLNAAMRVAVPAAKRNRSGSHAGGIGSFLSIVSTDRDSQPSGTTSSNPFTSLARTGSRLFAGVIRELPPLPGLGRVGKSLPVTHQPQKSLEETWLPGRRTLPGRSSPWGSFADTLAKRLRAVGEMQQPAGADQPQTPRPGTRMQHASSLETEMPESESSKTGGEVQLTQRTPSMTSSPTLSLPGVSLENSRRAASLTFGQSSGKALTGFRTNSVPRFQLPAPHVSAPAAVSSSPEAPPDFPSIASSPPELAQEIEQAVELDLATSDSLRRSFAEEVAQTFAVGRPPERLNQWPQALPSTPPAATGDQRPPLRRADTPKSALSAASLALSSISDPESPTHLSNTIPAHEMLVDAESRSSSLRYPSTSFEAAGMPREIAPRSALQMARLGPTEEVGSVANGESPQSQGHERLGAGAAAGSSGRRLRPGQDGAAAEEASSRIQRSSRSERSLDEMQVRGDAAGLDVASRSSSATSPHPRISRFSARRNAVLDVAHRRQIAQEGLADAGHGTHPVERTWSFATEGTHHSEFAPVPEDVAESEVESSFSSRN